MQSLKKFYFGKQKVKVPNTFIGGIGGTINTPALLAAKLGVSENRIKLFKVTGVDVECAVIGSYTMPTDAWSGNTTGITYFDDIEGKCTSFQAHPFRANNKTILRAFFPKCTQVLRQAFFNAGVIKVIYMPALISLPEQNGVFATVSKPRVYLNPFLATSNAGAEDAQVAYARSQGATISYVTNFTTPNPVTNLSVGTIYNTAVQLNFTPPTSVNGVDFYECYANGKLMNEIKNSGGFIAGLTPSTNYNIRIVAVDMFYNKSELSNTLNVSTTSNLSDTDATAYTTASSNIAYQYAINDLFKGLKDNSLYTKIQAFYPFLGTTAAQHKWNAKNPLDTNVAFRLQFFGGGTHSNLGYQCNGTNAYANTFFVPSVNFLSVNSQGCTIVVGTNNNAVNSIELGTWTSSTQAFLLSSKRNQSSTSKDMQISGMTIRTNTDYNSIGILTGIKTDTLIAKMFKNKNLIQSSTSTNSGVLTTRSVFIGASNEGSAVAYSPQRIQFTVIHEGLTDAEVIALHTIIDNFESAIGRKNW